MRRKHSGWEWSTGRENALHLGEQIARLLDSLGPYLSRIGEARQIFDLEAEISCAVYIEGQAPSIHLDLGALKLINQLEAEIDLDIIVFPDPAEE